MNTCECGCGVLVRRRFAPGHNVRVKPIKPQDPRPLAELILARCIRVGACLVWQGATVKGGYGMVKYRQKRRAVHRVVYEHFHGAIPDGYQIDHVRANGCRSTACCEPTHLEAVTPLENIRRGHTATKTHCKRGHEFTPDNLKPRPYGRVCLACVRMHERERTLTVSQQRAARRHSLSNAAK